MSPGWGTPSLAFRSLLRVRYSTSFCHEALLSTEYRMTFDPIMFRPFSTHTVFLRISVPRVAQGVGFELPQSRVL